MGIASMGGDTTAGSKMPQRFRRPDRLREQIGGIYRRSKTLGGRGLKPLLTAEKSVTGSDPPTLV
jgi:hypothetical protein